MLRHVARCGGLLALLLGTVAVAQESPWQALVGEWEPTDARPAGLTWTETEGGVQAELPSDVLFDFDSSTLRPEARTALAQLAQGIREREPRRVRIEGHTDAKGSDAYNEELSERRAEAVLRHLVEVETIDRALLRAQGLGESRPKVPNTHPDGSDDPEGRQRNRRVDVILDLRG